VAPRLAVTSSPTCEPAEEESLHERDDESERMRRADPEEEASPAHVHAGRCGEDLTQARRRPSRSGGGGLTGSSRYEDEDGRQAGEHEDGGAGLRRSLTSVVSLAHADAEEVGRAESRTGLRRNGVAAVAPAFRPCDGSVHWVFRFGPVGPLKNAGWSSPQRPSNWIQETPRVPRRVARIVATSGRSSVCGRACRRSPHPLRELPNTGHPELVRVRPGGG